MLTQGMQQAIYQGAMALEKLVMGLSEIAPETNRALGRIADALEAANNPTEEAPVQQTINVGLDEAVISPYEVEGYPIVRYQMPDKSLLVWQVVAVPYDAMDPSKGSLHLPVFSVEVNGERFRLTYDPITQQRLADQANG